MKRRGLALEQLPPAIAAQARAKYAEALQTSARAANAETIAPAPRSKYGASATVVDGIRFDSKLEARVYEQLQAAVARGEVTYFLRQVPLHLPGGVRYVVDFQAFRAYGGSNVCQVRYFDAKGVDTPTGKAKRRIAEATHRIHVELVTRDDVGLVARWTDGRR